MDSFASTNPTISPTVIRDKEARAAFFAFARELLEKAAQLEATPTNATAEATGTAVAMQETTDITKPPDDRSRPIARKKKPRR